MATRALAAISRAHGGTISRTGGNASEKSFLHDAFQQLDEVLKRRVTDTHEVPSGEVSQRRRQIKEADQMIQRWLVVFAREHLADICHRIMIVSVEHAVPSAAPQDIRLPHARDEPENPSDHRDDSTTFFLLETLRRVLSAAADGGSAPNNALRSVPESLLPFCFERLSLANPTAVRHVAALCVGILSRAHLKATVELLLGQAGKLSTDRDQREYVAYAKASANLSLSVHSAEQAGSTARYLSVVSKLMEKVTRGVLRAQTCASLRNVLTRLMDSPADGERNEWRDFCAASSRETATWWMSYAASYEAAFKWAKKPTHAPFCYELLVTMLALAALPGSAPGGAEFATPARRSRMLSLLAAGNKKEPLRSTCVPLAAQHVCALPPDSIRADLESSSKAAASASTLKLLVSSLMPRKVSVPANEMAPIEETLLVLASAQPDCAYVLSLITDSLSPASQSAFSPSQRALLLRLLARLSEDNPEAISPIQQSLLTSLRSALRAEAHQHLAAASAAAAAAAGGPPIPEAEGSGLLPAVISAVPRLWSTEEDAKEASDLAWLARLLCSDEHETSTAAYGCLELLVVLQPARLTIPVLTALARMLLSRDGARPTQLARALNYATFLVKSAVDGLVSTFEQEAVTISRAPSASADAFASTTSTAKPGDGPAASSLSTAADARPEFRAQWDELRQVIQASSITWVVHSLSDISQQAAALLNAFDSEAAMHMLAPPAERIALRSILPAQWGWDRVQGPTTTFADGGTRRQTAATGQLLRDVERALDQHYDDIFPSVSLAWMQLAHQVGGGPRIQLEDASGTDTVALWAAQLAFVCRFARERLSPHYAPHGVTPKSNAAGTAPKPLHDPHTNTYGAMEEDVEHIVARSLRWLLSPNTGSEVLRGVNKALRVAHPSLIALIVIQMRQANNELQQAQVPRGLASGLQLFGIGAPPKLASDLLSDLYFQPQVVQMLADTFQKITAHELARRDEKGRLLHAQVASTLEEVCQLWLRERIGSRVAALSGKTLAHAARLMTCYLRFKTASIDQSRRGEHGSMSHTRHSSTGSTASQGSSLPTTPADTEQGAATMLANHSDDSLSSPHALVTTPEPTNASSSSARSPPAASTVSMSDIRSIFELLVQWMGVALSPETPNPVQTSAVGDGFGTSLIDPRDNTPRVATSTDEAVLHAVESLIGLHATADPQESSPHTATPSARDRHASVEKGAHPAERNSGTSPLQFEAELRMFLETLLGWSRLRRHVCIALATLLCCHGSELETFLCAALKGHVVQASLGTSHREEVHSHELPELDAARWQQQLGTSAKDRAGHKRAQSRDAGSSTASHPTASVLRSVTRMGTVRLGEIASFGASRDERTSTQDASCAPHRVTTSNSMFASLASESPGSHDNSACLTHAYLYAVVSNVASDMKRWHVGIEARLLFLSLLHQVSEHDSLRDLGLQLAQILAHSSHTRLMPPHAHQLPLASARSPSPLVYTAAPFRFSSALAPEHISLLPKLLREMVTHFAILTVEDREALLQMLLPWLRALANAFDKAPTTDAPVTPETKVAETKTATTRWNHEKLHADLLAPVLESLLSLSRLTASSARAGLTAESAHMVFLVEAAWAALVSRGSTPSLVPALTKMLLQSHANAAAFKPADGREMALCEQILVLASRTPCAPQLLGSVIAQLRNYLECHCPGIESPTDWLGWRRGLPAAREPLSAYELAALPMLTQLTYELHTLLPAHLPLLLHVITVCYASEASSCRALAPDCDAADDAAATLLRTLLSNLAPRGYSNPLTQAELDALLARAAALRPGLAAVRPLVELLTPVSEGLEEEWRQLALHWAVHARDPDLSLASLRAFALLGTRYDAALLHTLTLMLCGALRDGATAKAQLLLRLLRTLVLCAVSEGSDPCGSIDQLQSGATPLPSSSWLQLASAAAAMLSSRCEPLILEALKLLDFVLNVCDAADSGVLASSSGRTSPLLRRASSGTARSFAHMAIPQELSRSSSTTSAIAGASLQAASAIASGFEHDENGVLTRKGSDGLESNRDEDLCAAADLLVTSQAPSMSQLLSHLHTIWRYGEASGSAIAPLDEHISARLLKGVSVGAEVSAECRRETLHMIEKLAVSYADEIAPTNTLTITGLLSHALEVTLALSSTPTVAAATPGSSQTSMMRGEGDRNAEEVAGDAMHFLEQLGSASFERLVDLFTEIAEEDDAEDGGEATRRDRPERVSPRKGAVKSGSSSKTTSKTAADAGKASRADVSRSRKSGLHQHLVKERSRKSIDHGLTGQDPWQKLRFDERFFEGFALAFHTAESVAFTARLLTSWLRAASLPLLGDKLTANSKNVQGVFAAGSGRRLSERLSERSVRARGEARHSRRLVASLLRLLSAFIRQYAPTECQPEQFAELAPIVVAHFTHHTQHFAHQKLDLQEDIARTAERLLSEMVSRAPAGTPRSIFSLLSTTQGAASAPLASRIDSVPLIEWDEAIVPCSEVATLQCSLHECADRVQTGVLGVPTTSGTGSISKEHLAQSAPEGSSTRVERDVWPSNPPRASIDELPSSDPLQSLRHSVDREVGTTSPTGQEAEDAPQMASALSQRTDVASADFSSTPPATASISSASTESDGSLHQGLHVPVAPASVTSKEAPPLLPPPPPPPDEESSPARNTLDEDAMLPLQQATIASLEHGEHVGPPAGQAPRSAAVNESAGSWISTIGPLARLDDTDDLGSIDGDEEDEELMVDLDDDDDEYDDDDGDDMNVPGSIRSTVDSLPSLPTM